MELKEKVALSGIGLTFLVAITNLIYSFFNNRKTAFVNTVTASRLKWIDSLRDKVSAFIAVTVRILDRKMMPKEPEQNIAALLRERDTLMHQIILHLNPGDAKDQAIRHFVEHAVDLTGQGIYSEILAGVLVQLRDATQEYLKKEWERVKRESKSGEPGPLKRFIDHVK